MGKKRTVQCGHPKIFQIGQNNALADIFTKILPEFPAAIHKICRAIVCRNHRCIALSHVQKVDGTASGGRAAAGFGFFTAERLLYGVGEILFGIVQRTAAQQGQGCRSQDRRDFLEECFGFRGDTPPLVWGFRFLSA